MPRPRLHATAAARHAAYRARQREAGAQLVRLRLSADAVVALARLQLACGASPGAVVGQALLELRDALERRPQDAASLAGAKL